MNELCEYQNARCNDKKKCLHIFGDFKKGEFLKKAHKNRAGISLSNGNALSPKSTYQNDCDSGLEQQGDCKIPFFSGV